MSSAQNRQQSAKHERCSEMMGEGYNKSYSSYPSLSIQTAGGEVGVVPILRSPSGHCAVCVHLKWRQYNYAEALKSRACVKGSTLCICFVPSVAWWQQFVKHTGKVTAAPSACRSAGMTPLRSWLIHWSPLLISTSIMAQQQQLVQVAGGNMQQ